MKVKNMTNSRGNAVPNQFIISNSRIAYKGRTGEILKPPVGDMFQSYSSNIAFCCHSGQVFLDEKYWDYSRTTGTYRNQFLGENKKETERKIANGTYKLVDLN